MIIGRNFAESYYEDERLYSTGSDELDDLLERAFCEGYEYAQREFAEEEEEEDEPKKNHRGAKIAAGVAGGLATAGAGIYGAKKLGQHIEKNGGRILKSGNYEVGDATQTKLTEIQNKIKGAKAELSGKELEKKVAKLEKQKNRIINNAERGARAGRALQVPYDAVVKGAKKVGNKAKEVAKKRIKK
jgi:hypothetical protein